MPDLTKPWWQSKTIWGGIGTMLVFAISFATRNPASPADMQQGADALEAIAGGVCGLLTIYGRLRATHKIG